MMNSKIGLVLSDERLLRDGLYGASSVLCLDILRDLSTLLLTPEKYEGFQGTKQEPLHSLVHSILPIMTAKDLRDAQWDGNNLDPIRDD